MCGAGAGGPADPDRPPPPPPRRWPPGAIGSHSWSRRNPPSSGSCLRRVPSASRTQGRWTPRSSSRPLHGHGDLRAEGRPGQSPPSSRPGWASPVDPADGQCPRMPCGPRQTWSRPGVLTEAGLDMLLSVGSGAPLLFTCCQAAPPPCFPLAWLPSDPGSPVKRYWSLGCASDCGQKRELHASHWGPGVPTLGINPRLE